MIETSCVVDRPDFWARLDEGFRSDLCWWISFLELWNGKVLISTDTSGNWRSGVVRDKNWIQRAWDGD